MLYSMAQFWFFGIFGFFAGFGACLWSTHLSNRRLSRKLDAELAGDFKKVASSPADVRHVRQGRDLNGCVA